MKIETRFDVNDEVYFLYDHKITVGYVECVNFSKQCGTFERDKIKSKTLYLIRYNKEGEKDFASLAFGISEESCFSSREELIMSIQ